MNKTLIAFLITFAIASCKKKEEGRNSETLDKVKNSVIYSDGSCNIAELDSLNLHNTSFGDASISDVGFEYFKKEDIVVQFTKNESCIDSLFSQYLQKKAKLSNEDLIKYFIVFSESSNPEILKDLIKYVEINKSKDFNKLRPMDHPFYYAIFAVGYIAEVDHEYPYREEAVDKFLKEVKKWQDDSSKKLK